jgi:hypothetical protein
MSVCNNIKTSVTNPKTKTNRSHADEPNSKIKLNSLFSNSIIFTPFAKRPFQAASKDSQFINNIIKVCNLPNFSCITNIKGKMINNILLLNWPEEDRLKHL